ncbi:hypothetical protein Tco_0345000 [Tanacetum coccineum]
MCCMTCYVNDMCWYAMPCDLSVWFFTLNIAPAGTRGRSGDQGDGRIDGQGRQIGGQGSEVNNGVNGVPDFSTIIAHQLQNLLPTIVAQRATEPKTIQKAMQIADTLTNEALRNGSIKKNHEKRGNRGEPSKDRNVRDDNKRTRARNAFAITANPVRGGYTACPRLNQAQRPWGNPQNQLMAVSVGQGCGNQGNQVRGRAFMLRAEEARQDPNIMTGAFTLNDHYATTLFDSDADYSFVSTTFIPLLDIELVI